MKKNGESGFAMLLVFLMAAVIAISLYIQIPRVAFEAQRQKEQLLVERGEQYKRAIQLFVRANGRYPSKIDDLENFNNRRFLRHKFKDPITGKSEWRLIHINGAGIFTDSLTNKPKQDDKNQSISTKGSVAELPELGAVAAGQQGQQTVTSAANRRRASEGGAAPTILGPDGQPVQPQNIGFPGAPGGQPYPGQPYAGAPQQAYQPPTAPTDQANPTGQPGYALGAPNPQMGNNPAPGGGPPVPPEVNAAGGQAVPGQAGQFGQAGQPGQPTGQPTPVRPAPVMPPPGQYAVNNQSVPNSSIGGASSSIGGGQSSVGGESSLGSTGSSLGGAVAGQPRVFPTPIPTSGLVQPNQPAQPLTSAPPQYAGAQPNPSDPGAANTPVTPQNPGAGFAQAQQVANPATSMIQNMLTTPRQAPQSAAAGSTQPGGQQIGAGIAGVASTSEDASIMIYNQKSNYNEWEFIFDYTKQKAAPNANAGANGTPVQNMGTLQPGNAGASNSGVGTGSSFGNGSSLGNGSGFGNSSGLGNTSGFGNTSSPGQSPSPQGQQPPPNDLRLGQP